MSTNASARPEQTQSIPQIVADALRRAALAPTDLGALDITGAALITVAMLVRMEANHV